MRPLVTYTVEWRVLKSSSSSVARRRWRRLDNASSWFAGGVTGRRGCCNARRLLITQSIHARLLLLLYMTTTSSHSTRRTAAATLRATLTIWRTWAVTFGHAMYYHLKCQFPCGNLGHGSRLSSHPKQQLDRLFSHFRNNVHLLQCKTLNFISPQLQP